MNLEKLNELMEISKKSDASKAVKKAYKEEMVALLKEEGISSSVERYLWGGFSFCGAQPLFEYAKELEKEEKVRVLEKIIKTETFTKNEKCNAFRMCISWLAFEIEQPEKDLETIAVLIKWASAKYKKKDGSISKDNSKCIEKYFIAVLKSETQYPLWESVPLHKEIIKDFCAYFCSEIEPMKNDKNSKKLDPVIAWLNSGKQETNDCTEVEQVKNENSSNEVKAIGDNKELLADNSIWDFNRVALVLEEMSEKASVLGVEHRKLQKKKEELISTNKSLSETLENTQGILNAAQAKLSDAESTIAHQNTKIEELNAEIVKLSSIVSVYAEDKQSSMDGQLNAIASKLKSEYKEFQDALEAEMTAEVGEIVRDQLHRVFKILIKAGIDIEGR